MEPAVYLLVGFPATGKYTVAQALAEELRTRDTDAAVIDNHYVNNPIFGVLHTDGVTPLPAGIWPLVDQVRDAVLTAAERFSPPRRSFIFTNYITDEEAAEKPVVGAYLDRLRSLAAPRGGRFHVVRLTCAVDELCRRITSPERQQRLKATSPEWVREETQTRTLFSPAMSNVLTLDVTAVQPAEAARRIADHRWEPLSGTSSTPSPRSRAGGEA